MRNDMTDGIERLMADDLARFTEMSAQVPAMPHDLGLSQGPYRDNRGAQLARRDADYEERRIELALLPLRLGRVFAHRVARTAAGGLALLGGLALAGLMTMPSVMASIGFAAGDVSVEYAIVLSLFSVAVFYLLALLIAEHGYEWAAARVIRSSLEPIADLDRTRPGPDLVMLVRRFEAVSTVLPYLGAVVLGSLLGILTMNLHTAFNPDLARAGLYGLDPRAYRVVRLHLLSNNLSYMIAALGAFSALGFPLWKACSGAARGNRSLSLAIFGHGGMLAVAAIVGFWVLLSMHQAEYSPLDRWVLVFAGVAAVTLATTWVLLRLRRRELRSLSVLIDDLWD